MRYFFDTEFMEDGKTIELLSIGVFAEDGRELYLESSDADHRRANPWVREHVLPKLHGGAMARPRKYISRAVRDFCTPGFGKPEFWAYYANYDWVVLCQLFGSMVDLPEGWPMYCRDFKQWLDEHGNPPLNKLRDSVGHNALVDARWLAQEFARLHGTE